MAVADELVAVALGSDEVAEGDESVPGGTARAIQLWLPCLAALLHCGDENLIDAFGLYDATLAVVAVEEGELVEAYLGGLLDEPLHAVHHLGGRHCKVEMSLPGWLLRHDFLYAVGTAMIRCRRNGGAIEAATAIHEEYLVAHAEPQDADSVAGLVAGQLSGR